MDRRRFLQASAVSMAALQWPIHSKVMAANSATINLAATVMDVTVPERATPLPVWRFMSMEAPGPGGLGFTLVAHVGDTITINLENQLDRPINLSIPGQLENAAETLPGAVGTYTVTLSQAGSFVITDAINGALATAMGLSAPVIVKPVSNDMELADGRIVDQDYLLFFNDVDDRINDAVAAGTAVDLTTFEPNFFFVNNLMYGGLNSPGLGAVENRLAMTVGQQVAIRLVNGSLIYYPMHFHGYHVDVVSRNGVLQSPMLQKDTVMVNAGEGVDCLLAVNQPGTYPLHSHFLPAVTANGVYGKGGLVIMEAV